ncbi:MAG: tetratricopeptide repeat protein [Methylacidiphilales bacterium]|nr:tetratricopeptide repeat protein [Candidatus Methylacidiphilales bacterium]
MKFSRIFPAWLITAVVVTQSQVVLALTPQEVNSIAKEFTVLIGGDGIGSGVIYEKKGNVYYVLTNQHVIGADGRYEIQTVDGGRYPVYRSREIPGLDLAVLEFNSNKNYRVAAIANSDQVREGMPIYVVGWADAIPGITRERSYQFTDGTVRSLLAQGNSGYTLVYNNEAIPGMSGGPVVDGEARVIGINGKAKTEEEKDGSVKLGLRLGIPINTFLASTKSTPSPGIRNNAPTVARVARKPSAEEFISLGGAKADKQDHQGAIAAYNKALQLDPNNPDAYQRRGNSHVQLKNWQAGLADFNQVLRLNPKNAFAYAYRSYIRLYLGDFQESFNDSDKSIQIEPNSPTTTAISYGARGVANLALGKKQDAIRDIAQASKLSPELGKAFKGFEQISLIPYNEAEFLRAIVRGGLGDKQGAIADLEKAGTIYQRQGRTQDVQVVKLLIQQVKDGTFGTNSSQTGNNQSSNNQPINNQPRQNPIATTSPNQKNTPISTTARSTFDRAFALYNQGDKKAALDNLNQATRINPQFSQAWYSRGFVLGELGNYDEALVSYNRAIQVNREWGQATIGDAYFMRGILQSERENYQQAKADFDAVINLKPAQNIAAIYAMRGLNAQRQGNNKAALADFNQAARLEPNNAIAYLARGWSYHMQGDFQGAIAAYEKAATQNPKLLAAVNNLGLIKYELQDIEGAIKQFQSAIAIDGNSAEPQMAMAALLYAKGDRQMSLTIAENALRLNQRFANQAFLRKNLWGKRLIADAQKLLQNPKLQAFTSR